MSKLNSHQQRITDFQSVFLGTEQGERVLQHLYQLCGMNRQIHTPGDAHDTSFKAGQHRVGQAIHNLVTMTADEIRAKAALGGSEGEPEKYHPYNKKD